MLSSKIQQSRKGIPYTRGERSYDPQNSAFSVLTIMSFSLGLAKKLELKSKGPQLGSCAEESGKGTAFQSERGEGLMELHTHMEAGEESNPSQSGSL